MLSSLFWHCVCKVSSSACCSDRSATKRLTSSSPGRLLLLSPCKLLYSCSSCAFLSDKSLWNSVIFSHNICLWVGPIVELSTGTPRLAIRRDVICPSMTSDSRISYYNFTDIENAPPELTLVTFPKCYVANFVTGSEKKAPKLKQRQKCWMNEYFQLIIVTCFIYVTKIIQKH